jgi:cell division protein FtsB
VSLGGDIEARLEEYDRAYAQMETERAQLVRVVQLLVDGVRAEVHPAARGRLSDALDIADRALRKHGGV